jgi:poly(3-hydroxybutyrate) depolymerase
MKTPTIAARTVLLTLANGCLLALTLAGCSLVHASPAPELKTASSHPIQYYLSLPNGWTATKKWPVVVVIESADREFLQAATAFANARGSRPFIIVTPLVITNGGAGFRSVPTYHYSDAVWDRIQSSGQFQFDMDGLTAIVQDVTKQYRGEEKFFLTGFEAGGHTVYGVLFNHPEMVRAAVAVCPNYQGRWVDDAHISTAPERVDLPIKNFAGGNDTLCSAGKPIHDQMLRAMTVASEHGYKNVAEVRIEGRGHERMESEVLDFFASQLSR